jgi:hypothetical protein
MIKKTATLILCTLLFIVLLTACGDKENSEIVGKWVPTTATLNGTTVQYSTLDLDDDQFGFEFTSDGKCSATLTGITSTGTYTFSDTAVDIVINGESQKLSYDSGTLTLVMNYDDNPMSVSFTKER